MELTRNYKLASISKKQTDPLSRMEGLLQSLHGSRACAHDPGRLKDGKQFWGWKMPFSVQFASYCLKMVETTQSGM